MAQVTRATALRYHLAPAPCGPFTRSQVRVAIARYHTAQHAFDRLPRSDPDWIGGQEETFALGIAIRELAEAILGLTGGELGRTGVSYRGAVYVPVNFPGASAPDVVVIHLRSGRVLGAHELVDREHLSVLNL